MQVNVEVKVEYFVEEENPRPRGPSGWKQIAGPLAYMDACLEAVQASLLKGKRIRVFREVKLCDPDFLAKIREDSKDFS